MNVNLSLINFKSSKLNNPDLFQALKETDDLKKATRQTRPIYSTYKSTPSGLEIEARAMLLEKQAQDRSRSGDIKKRLGYMETHGYKGIVANTEYGILDALEELKPETISALNNVQLYRICEINNGRRNTIEGLQALEEEFTTKELQRISEKDCSSIINTWITKQISSDEGFENLTRYIHMIAKK